MSRELRNREVYFLEPKKKDCNVRKFDLVFCEIGVEKPLSEINYQDLIFEFLAKRKRQNNSHLKVETLMNEIVENQLAKMGEMRKDEKKRIKKRVVKKMSTFKNKYMDIQKNSKEDECYQELIEYFKGLQGINRHDELSKIYLFITFI